MSAEKKQKQAIVKLITIIPIIICLVVIIFLIIAVFSKGKITQPEIQPANEKNQGENQTETSPAQNVGVENKTVAESPIDIEKIKMDIITGKREDVPPEVGEDKQLIIAQYLYDCYMILDINERAACYDVYYMNNDANYKQQKESCEKLNNQEFTNCMDSLYYNASAYLGANLCPAIKDYNLRENCLTSIK